LEDEIRKMNIVDRIRVLANSRGMSLPDLEIELGLGNGTISRWKTSSPNSDKLVKIADYFDESIDFLLGRSNKIYESDPDIRRVKCAMEKMSPDERKKMMKILEASLEEYFSDNF
jgi:transcriptional regulator with XRE-family HTH domain